MADEALFETSDGIALLTLNRPAVHNTINEPMAAAVSEYLDEVDRDSGRVAIVTRSGSRVISAGADLKQLASAGGGQPKHNVTSITSRFVGKPPIAAVNGLALGGGTEIALAGGSSSLPSTRRSASRRSGATSWPRPGAWSAGPTSSPASRPTSWSTRAAR